MKRQWTEDQIMPATARNQLQFYYGLISHQIPEVLEDLLGDVRAAADVIGNQILQQLERRFSEDYWMKNGSVFIQVVSQDVMEQVQTAYKKSLQEV